ncbi:MAG TPA: ankyrin repeat domain-containing protein, partial [Thermoanaerobaculia bacterium]
MPVSLRRSVLLFCGFVLLAAVLATGTATGAEDQGEALREAARAGDLAKVDALLAAGAPVDAPARYGQTPLYFAAEKGHFPVVKRLIERGANVNAEEGFFGSTPLGIALQGGHRELALYLLAHGAEGAPDVLFMAIEGDDLELARAALATGFLEPLDLAAVRKEMEGRTGPMSELLATATAKPRERPPYKAAPERLAIHAGRYRDQEGKEVKVEARGNGVGLTLPGQTETVLNAVEEDRFDSADGNMSI